MGALRGASLLAGLFVAGCDLYVLEVRGLILEAPESYLIVGDEMPLSLTELGGEAGAIPYWRSSDESVASVSPAGVVTGNGAGWVVISVRLRDMTVEAPLKVWTLAPLFTEVFAAADGEHACALTAEGRAWCWGSDQYGELGTADSPDSCRILVDLWISCSVGALPVDSQERFSSLALGTYHTCGLTPSGRAHCWGRNDSGQLGDGTTQSRSTPRALTGDLVFTALSAAHTHTCGITDTGALFCWGANRWGAMGDPADSITTPRRTAPGHRFQRVATSQNHTCGHTVEGSTFCWGANQFGQLGVDGVRSSCPTGSSQVPCTSEPQEVGSAPPFTTLAATFGGTCGLSVEGAAFCWGRNDRGQLGDGTRENRTEPTPVMGALRFSRLTVGRSHVCALDESGAAFCWGEDVGSFGLGRERHSGLSPERAAPAHAFGSLSAGLEQTCGIAQSGLAWCWGRNLAGQLGNGRSGYPVPLPVRVVSRE
jgi:alpha-tubulin suppressor-like RCC1 family protein